MCWNQEQIGNWVQKNCQLQIENVFCTHKTQTHTQGSKYGLIGLIDKLEHDAYIADKTILGLDLDKSDLRGTNRAFTLTQVTTCLHKSKNNVSSNISIPHQELEHAEVMWFHAFHTHKHVKLDLEIAGVKYPG